jgi:hypothetical protein
VIPEKASNSAARCSLDLHDGPETSMQYVQRLGLDTSYTNRFVRPQILIRVTTLLKVQQAAVNLHVLDFKMLVQTYSKVVGLAKVSVDKPLTVQIFTAGVLAKVVEKSVGKVLVAVAKFPAT